MIASPGLARLAATQAVNLPRPKPRRNDGTMERTSRFAHSIIPSFHHSTYRIYDFSRRAENAFQTITAHVRQSQLSGLNDRADFIQRREQAGEAVVIVNGVRFNEP